MTNHSDHGEPTWPSGLQAETVAVTAGRPGRPGQALNHPIIPATNFRHGGPTSDRDYARADSTDTAEALEEAVAALELVSNDDHGITGRGVAYGSGMAAISAVFDLLPAGARIIAPSDCYQGTASVLDHGAATRQWSVTRLPTDDSERWIAATTAEQKPDLVWLESPSNPLLAVADVPAICEAGRHHNVVVAVDNTFATPLLQQPLLLGATFSVHSATKFLAGHSDVLAGITVVADSELAQQLVTRRTLVGSTIGSLEAFLTLRGLRTLAVRLERAQSSAQVLATRLSQEQSITAVHYPGLEASAGFEVARRTLAGPGAVLSLETGASAATTDAALDQLRVIARATSLGGVESTAERRSRLAGQESVPESLVRLSVGCEHVEDLWSDLATFLAVIGRDS